MRSGRESRGGGPRYANAPLGTRKTAIAAACTSVGAIAGTRAGAGAGVLASNGAATKLSDIGQHSILPMWVAKAFDAVFRPTILPQCPPAIFSGQWLALAAVSPNAWQ